MSSRTRIIVHSYSRLWQPILAAAEGLGLKYPQPLLNWTTVEDVSTLLHLTDFDAVHSRKHILLPKRIPFVTNISNRYLAHLALLRHLCLTNWIVARPLRSMDDSPKPTVSVVCPCRNEAGNIEHAIEPLPSLGSHTELIFVEGHSRDGTLEACRRAIATAKDKDVTVLVQQGRGKGDAVRLGFSAARGDVLMILDADLSVPPEDLVHFYDALVSGKAIL